MEIRYPTGSAGRSTAAASSGIETLARLGYAAKGFVFLLTGGLAVQAAVGAGGRTTDTRGALGSIDGSTLGTVLLAAIALGLAGYVVWSAVRAISNPEHDGPGKRVFFALVAVIYASLAFEAARMALNRSDAGGGSDSAQHWSARLMAQPFGAWLLGIAGIAIALYGVQQLMQAWRVDLDDQLALSRISAAARSWVVAVGRFGLAARGVVFGIIGGYVVAAAVQSQPAQARGLDGVLDLLAQTPWLLIVIGAGLAAYGIYNFVRARYRVIRPD